MSVKNCFRVPGIAWYSPRMALISMSNFRHQGTIYLRREHPTSIHCNFPIDINCIEWDAIALLKRHWIQSNGSRNLKATHPIWRYLTAELELLTSWAYEITCRLILTTNHCFEVSETILGQLRGIKKTRTLLSVQFAGTLQLSKHDQQVLWFWLFPIPYFK